MDIPDVARLAIFIRGVDDIFIITNEFVELVPMTDTITAADIFTALVGALYRVRVDWSSAVRLATDGGEKSRCCDKTQRESADCKWKI